MATRFLFLLFSLGHAYHLGEDHGGMCWRSSLMSNDSACAPPGTMLTVQLPQCPGLDNSSLLSSIDISATSKALLSRGLVAFEISSIYYRIVVHPRPPGGLLQHVNIHSCEAQVGFCSPFVSNTPGLATHTKRLNVTLDADGVADVVSDVQLADGQYTVMVHAQWIDTAGDTIDMSNAFLGAVVLPPPMPPMPPAVSVATVAAVALLIASYWRMVRMRNRQVLVRRTGQPPTLSLRPEHRWHCFLSHTWATGQDQARACAACGHRRRPPCCVCPSNATPRPWRVAVAP